MGSLDRICIWTMSGLNVQKRLGSKCDCEGRGSVRTHIAVVYVGDDNLHKMVAVVVEING